MLVAYVVCGTLVSWVAFGFVAGDWRGMGGLPIARAGGAGAVLALALMLLVPQTWVSLAYVVGLPALYFVLGQKAALVVAASRVARGRSRRLLRWLAQKSFPACERLARIPGAVSVKSATVASAEERARRPRRAVIVRRALVREEARAHRACRRDLRHRGFPRTDAQRAGRSTGDTRRLHRRAPGRADRGNRWTMFVIVAAVTIVVTLLHPFWVGHIRLDLKV